MHVCGHVTASHGRDQKKDQCCFVHRSRKQYRWLKHSNVDKKVPGSNLTCCFAGKVSSLPLLLLGDQPLAERAWR